MDHVVFRYGDEGEAGKFHGKSCFVEIVAPVDREWLGAVSDKLLLAEQEICGALKTSEQLLGEPAIELRIGASSEMLSQIFETVKANQELGSAVLKVILGGEAVPDSDDIFTSLRDVDDLDTSEENNYAILGFDIGASNAEFEVM